MLFPSKFPSKGPNFILEGNFLPNGNAGVTRYFARQLLNKHAKNYQNTATDCSLPTTSVELHIFGGASTLGVGTAVYSIVRQQDGTMQTLVAAKSRLAKRGLTIPRLELVSAHMATNLVTNVRNAWEDLREVTI